MNPRRVDDEQFRRTYFIEPIYRGEAEDDDRQTLVNFHLLYVDEEAADGSVHRLEGDRIAGFAPRVWELIRADDVLLEELERPVSAFEEAVEPVSHLQRMRELRRRLMIRRALDQDVG